MTMTGPHLGIPNPPRSPAAGKRITQESAPAADVVKIGIELEGVGTVATKWTNPAVLNAAGFHHAFKRMPLVRSRSYTDLRGVAITAEDGDQFGEHSLAELVSSPHKLTAENLAYLRNSVWKALRASDAPLTGQERYRDPRKAKPFPSIATTHWTRHRGSGKIGGSLQTTLGVCVGKLLADSATTRAAVVDLLVGSSSRKQYVKDLLTAAVAAERALTGATGALSGFAGTEGLRLALLYSFIDPACRAIPSEGKWGKDRLGCNFKGMSSFLGCGIAGAELPLVVAVKRAGRAASTTAVLNAVAASGVGAWLNAALAHWDILSHLGKPGLSAQTLYELWYSLPNFTKGGHLYTIIECREKKAVLNVKMADFLNSVFPGQKMPTYVKLASPDWNVILGRATILSRDTRAIIEM